jgi:hypothetical protein
MKIEFADRVWQVDVDALTLAQAVVITGRMGGSLTDWEKALEDPNSGDWLKALQALYWLQLAQDGQHVPIGDVDFPVLKYAQAVAAAIERDQAPAEVPADPTQPPVPAAGTSDPGSPHQTAADGSPGSPATRTW